MKLLIQPDDGVASLLKAISHAKQCIEIVVFRFDQREIEHALAAAVTRGVSVHALIANTNKSGEENLRRLETRFLGQGITVARTADDLVRHHGKMMIIDRRELWLLAFNFTHQDIDRSRSFGLVTTSRDLVREAERLFEADAKRLPYEAGSDRFIVSPANARKELAAFLRRARKQLLIYDPEVSDPTMIGILEERAKAGVEIRIIGKFIRRSSRIQVRKPVLRLHARTILRDGQAAFIGSQSLRELELDSRREVGLIFRDAKIIKRMSDVFLEDWERKELAEVAPVDEPLTAAKVAKRVAKAVAEELPPVAPAVNQAVREAGGSRIDAQEVESIVKDAVREAVREAVQDVVGEVVQHNGGGR